MRFAKTILLSVERWRIPSDNKIVFANRTVFSLLDLPEEKVLAASFIDLFNSAPRKIIKKLLHNIINVLSIVGVIDGDATDKLYKKVSEITLYRQLMDIYDLLHDEFYNYNYRIISKL